MKSLTVKPAEIGFAEQGSESRYITPCNSAEDLERALNVYVWQGYDEIIVDYAGTRFFNPYFQEEMEHYQARMKKDHNCNIVFKNWRNSPIGQ
ncbi:MAG: hypothetical protein LKE40_01070 [Spirochaetia bacterium]|jgi:uncharacterized protein Usg|nr:hypothetical protein [Spirochaetia bacterium]